MTIYLRSPQPSNRRIELSLTSDDSRKISPPREQTTPRRGPSSRCGLPSRQSVWLSRLRALSEELPPPRMGTTVAESLPPTPSFHVTLVCVCVWGGGGRETRSLRPMAALCTRWRRGYRMARAGGWAGPVGGPVSHSCADGSGRGRGASLRGCPDVTHRPARHAGKRPVHAPLQRRAGRWSPGRCV